MKSAVKIRLSHWNSRKPDRRMLFFLAAPPIDLEAERIADAVLAEVRVSGDRAISRYVRQFDGLVLSPSRFRISVNELERARSLVSAEFDLSARRALRSIETFARAGRRSDWEMPAPSGGRIGERFLPLQRVGLYIPGGASPLASTVLMTAGLARIAGVPEIVACTPCSPAGSVDPHILHAMHLAGVTEAYRIGGIQAIAALAYGTRTIRAVDKIVGPGGPYVTAAKRRVYGTVGLDMVAGPSEIAILADSNADPRCIAEDMLSQAEHGTGMERTLLSTTSMGLALKVQAILQSRSIDHPRGDCVRQVLTKRTQLAVSSVMADAIDLINRFAPEHLEILTRTPRKHLRTIRNAGAIFLGHWTPESAGDFAIGPSHVLPTCGTARFFSGLTVDDFRRRTSLLELTPAGLKSVLPIIRSFSQIEDLPSHGRSATLRFER